MFILDILKFISRISFDVIIFMFMFSIVLISIGVFFLAIPIFIVSVVGWLFWKGFIF